MRWSTVTPTSEICTEAKLLFIVQNYEVWIYRWNFPWLHNVPAKGKCIISFKTNFGGFILRISDLQPAVPVVGGSAGYDVLKESIVA
jgi:hypothetical protein